MEVYEETEVPPGARAKRPFTEITEVEDAGGQQEEAAGVQSTESERIKAYTLFLKKHRTRNRLHKENPDQFYKDVQRLKAFKQMDEEEQEAALALLKHDYDTEEAVENISSALLGFGETIITNVTGTKVEIANRPAQRGAVMWVMEKVAEQIPGPMKFLGWGADLFNVIQNIKAEKDSAKKMETIPEEEEQEEEEQEDEVQNRAEPAFGGEVDDQPHA